MRTLILLSLLLPLPLLAAPAEEREVCTVIYQYHGEEPVFAVVECTNQYAGKCLREIHKDGKFHWKEVGCDTLLAPKQ